MSDHVEDVLSTAAGWRAAGEQVALATVNSQSAATSRNADRNADRNRGAGILALPVDSTIR